MGHSRESQRHDVAVLVISTAAFDGFGLRVAYDVRVGWERIDARIIVAEPVSNLCALEQTSSAGPS